MKKIVAVLIWNFQHILPSLNNVSVKVFPGGGGRLLRIFWFYSFSGQSSIDLNIPWTKLHPSESNKCSRITMWLQHQNPIQISKFRWLLPSWMQSVFSFYPYILLILFPFIMDVLISYSELYSSYKCKMPLMGYLIYNLFG